MRYGRSEGAVAAQVDGQLVVLSPGMDFIAIDAMGEVIWDLLADPRTTDELVATLTERFEVDDDRCRSDVEAFLGQLAQHGLVVAQ